MMVAVGVTVIEIEIMIVEERKNHVLLVAEDLSQMNEEKRDAEILLLLKRMEWNELLPVDEIVTVIVAIIETRIKNIENHRRRMRRKRMTGAVTATTTRLKTNS